MAVGHRARRTTDVPVLIAEDETAIRLDLRSLLEANDIPCGPINDLAEGNIAAAAVHNAKLLP